MRLSQAPSVHPAWGWAVLIPLAAALVLSACAPIMPVVAPAEAPSAASAGGTVPSADAADISPELAEGTRRVEEYLDRQHEHGLFSGTSLIAQDGKVIWSKSYDMADREKAIPNTPQTIHRIFELSVQFTAAALLLLEQEGKLSMDDPICNYLDDCPEAWQPVTIHHLLSHTSGIPNYFDVNGVAAHKYTTEGATPDELVDLFRDLPLSFAPGERRYWSHSGYVLAGQIIERVSGQSYADFLEQHLFAPLGMDHSGYGDPPQGLALGYRYAGAKIPAAFDVSSLYASGGLYSTAEDLYRWNEALYNGKLLNPTQLQKMLTNHAVTEFDQGSGYGIVVYECLGRPCAGNGGYFVGHAAVLRRYLDERITIVVIGNQDMEVFAIHDEVEQSLFGAD